MAACLLPLPEVVVFEEEWKQKRDVDGETLVSVRGVSKRRRRGRPPKPIYTELGSCSNVPAKRSGLVDDSVVVLTPLEVLAVATETRLEMGGTRVAIPVGAYFIALASRWERTRQSCPLHGGSTVGDNPSGAIPTRSYTGGFEEGDHPKAVLPTCHASQ